MLHKQGEDSLMVAQTVDTVDEYIVIHQLGNSQM